MHKRMFGIFLSLVALVALGLTPTFAQASATILNVNNETMSPGGKVYILSTGLQFQTAAGMPSCSDNKIEAEVIENPGASVRILSSEFAGLAGSSPLFEGKPLCNVLGSGGSYAADFANLEGTLNFSEGKVTFGDASIEFLPFSVQEKGEKVTPLGYCSYDVNGYGTIDNGEGSFSLSASTVALEETAGNYCLAMAPLATFHLTDEEEEPVTVVE